jgi:hypothetical protein
MRSERLLNTTEKPVRLAIPGRGSNQVLLERGPNVANDACYQADRQHFRRRISFHLPPSPASPAPPAREADGSDAYCCNSAGYHCCCPPLRTRMLPSQSCALKISNHTFTKGDFMCYFTKTFVFNQWIADITGILCMLSHLLKFN